MSINVDVTSLLQYVTWGHIVAAYAAVKVAVAAFRAKAAKAAAKVEATAYADAHKLEADAKGAEVKIKSFVVYWFSELKKAI